MALDLDAINGTSSSEIVYKNAEDAMETSMSQFFDLLMAQVTNQDPENPMSDTEFVSQMAQFQALNETKQLNESMEALINDQKIASAYGLVGSIVTGIDSEGDSVTDMVAKVRIEEGNPLLILANNSQLELKDLVEISLL